MCGGRTRLKHYAFSTIKIFNFIEMLLRLFELRLVR